MEQMHATPHAPQEPLAPRADGVRAPRRRRPRRWLSWGTGVAMMVAVGACRPTTRRRVLVYQPCLLG